MVPSCCRVLVAFERTGGVYGSTCARGRCGAWSLRGFGVGSASRWGRRSANSGPLAVRLQCPGTWTAFFPPPAFACNVNEHRAGEAAPKARAEMASKADDKQLKKLR